MNLNPGHNLGTTTEGKKKKTWPSMMKGPVDC